jgi:hypothetical protein
MVDAYADLATFRQYLRAAAVIDDSDDPDTALETLALESAARAIDRACGRSFKVASDVATDRVFTPTTLPGYNPLDYISSSYPYALSRYPYTWYRHYVMDIDDLADGASITELKFDSTGDGDYTDQITGFRVGPTNAVSRGMPFTQVIFDAGIYPPVYDESVLITAKWGWAAVPSTIVNANLMQAARFLKRRDAAFGVAGSPEMGNEIRLLSKLDPDVALMVGAFKKNWGAV